MSRVKSFASTGVPPDGKLYAGDLNAMQDHFADASNFAQTVDVNILRFGQTDLQWLRYGAGAGGIVSEARLTGSMRADGIIRALGGFIGGTFTTATRDAIPAGGAPYGTLIINTNTNSYEWNSGTDGARAWVPIGGILDGTVTDAKIVAGGLSPSKITGTAVITTDARLSDARVPVNNSVGTASLVNGAVTPGKLSFFPAIHADAMQRIERGSLATVGTGFPYTVTFAHDFVSAPVVVCSPCDNAPPIAKPASITNHGFQINGAAWFDYSGAAGNVDWIAIGI